MATLAPTESYLARYEALCAHYDIKPIAGSCAGEDLLAVRAGELPLTRFIAVTRHDELYYAKPSSATLDGAQLAATFYAEDDIYDEVPVAVVDLATGASFEPIWDELPWRESSGLAPNWLDAEQAPA